ncbi:MAG: hypothetical protein KGJ55_08345 [Gammaproteobacteria bacterium]|nr:hypothetical protein [Gammaproteobacteria bacterium]
MGNRRIAVLVLGMHRSGTSLTAGLLHRLGLPFGPQLMPPSPDNPSGYFEDTEIVALHDRFLSDIGLDWSDPRLLPENWLDAPAALKLAEDLAALLQRSYGAAPAFVVKDPRLCRLLPLWRKLLAALEIEPRCLLVWRHPAQVAASLAKRDGLALEVSALLWLRHFLDAELHSRSLRRTLVGLTDILRDPAGCIGRALDELNLPAAADMAPHRAWLEALVAPALQHQRQRTLAEFSSPLRNWLERLCSQPEPLESPSATAEIRRELDAYDRFAGTCFAVHLLDLQTELHRRDEQLAALNRPIWWRLGRGWPRKRRADA